VDKNGYEEQAAISHVYIGRTIASLPSVFDAMKIP
jgi:hypothetical protein